MTGNICLIQAACMSFSAAQATPSDRIRPAGVHINTARAHHDDRIYISHCRKRASCTPVSARCTSYESAPELAYSIASHTQNAGELWSTGYDRPCRPCAAHFHSASDGSVHILPGLSAMPSLRIATSPERGAENQHAWMYNAAAVWHDDFLIPQLRVYASSTQDHHDQLQAEAILSSDCHRIDRARTAIHNYATISAFKPSARSSRLRPCMTHGLNTPHAA